MHIKHLKKWLESAGIRTAYARRSLIGYVFISPFILGFLFWFLIPMSTSAWMVFQDWNMMTPPKFIFLENFWSIFYDDLFWQSLKVTTIYSFVSVPLGMALSFAVALLLNIKVRGISVFRTLFYMPMVVPSVANAVLWAWMLNTDFGLINLLLRSLGFPKVRWLVDPNLALPSLIMVSLWGLGGAMVIYLAGLQGIPEMYYEAAEIDGAGRLAKLRYVTLPLMSPVIFFNLVMGVIGSFQVFAAGYLVTGGGPDNATLFYVLHLYRVGFKYFRMGEASALAWILFLIIVLMVIFVFRYFGRSVYYENEPSKG
jgi:multiple sugar transport system permease protein